MMMSPVEQSSLSLMRRFGTTRWSSTALAKHTVLPLSGCTPSSAAPARLWTKEFSALGGTAKMMPLSWSRDRREMSTSAAAVESTTQNAKDNEGGDGENGSAELTLADLPTSDESEELLRIRHSVRATNLVCVVFSFGLVAFVCACILSLFSGFSRVEMLGGGLNVFIACIYVYSILTEGQLLY